MASPHSSKVRFRSLEGAPLQAPPEWAPCNIEVKAVPDQLAELRLWRGDQLLDLGLHFVDGAAQIRAGWPRAGAGGYELYLEHPEGDEKIPFQIAPEKLTADAFEKLLDDLQRRLPATIAIGLQKAGGLAGLTIVAPQETTLAGELNRLTRACNGGESRPGLSDILHSVARRPHRILRTVDVWTRRERARRIDPTRLHQAFSRQGNLTESATRLNLSEHRVPLKVPEKHVVHSVDVYENRLLRAFLDQVDIRLRALARDAAAIQNAAICEQATALVEDLDRARRGASFLSEVSQLAEPPARLTMVLLKRSDYRAALEGFLEFRRSAVVQLDEPLLQAPLTNLPKLYEAWGTLEVIAAFLLLAEPLGYTVETERLVHRSAGRIWVEVLKDGEAAVELTHPTGRRARVIPQANYGGGSGLHSISFPKKPDVAVEVTGPGCQPRLWLFDPKYKLDSESIASSDPDAWGIPKGSPKPQDINAMHAYRDAIRDENDCHAVQFAAILYPGPTRFFGAGLAALSAYPGMPELLATPLTDLLAQALDPAFELEPVGGEVDDTSSS